MGEVAHFQEWCQEVEIPVRRPNSMNKYGVILADMGLSLVFDAVVSRLRPLTAKLFPDVGGASLDSHHTFTVEYFPDGDRTLGFHVDSCQVTLNLCLHTSSDL